MNEEPFSLHHPLLGLTSNSWINYGYSLAIRLFKRSET